MTRQEAISRLEGSAPFSELYDEEWENALIMAIEALKSDPQRAYEQGVKDALNKYDETCRIASVIRMAMGCNSAKECWELIDNGEIQRIKHGRWKPFDLTWGRSIYACTNCGEAFEVPTEMGTPIFIYCPNCGAKMNKEDEE